MHTRVIVLILVISFFNSLNAQTLTMGYRTSERLPLIGNAPNNSGLYFDLYSAAAKKINVELKIIRLPKKRILNKIKDGLIDFYPGLTFTYKRSQFAYYLENGLKGGDVGISLIDFPLIEKLSQLKGKRVLTALGGPDEYLLSNIKGIKLNKVSQLSLKKAIALLRLKRDEFYVYNVSSIKYYLKINNINDIKLHPNCCGGEKPMYLGFSRNSKHYKEIKNPNFDKNKPISITNLPTLISKESLAYKFYKALHEMKESGEINEIVNKYYK